jgi:Mycotoxin biosynthesis protein UstYa
MQLRVCLFPLGGFIIFTTLGLVLFFSDGSLSRIQSHICPELLQSWDTRSVLRAFRRIRLLEKDSGHPNTTFESLLLPRNGGFLKVRMSDDPEIVTDYGISMFHQLHCLAVLRELVFSGNFTSQAGHHAREERVHWAHCFDYLAQVRTSR